MYLIRESFLGLSKKSAMLKRSFDIVFSIFGIVILLPVLIGVAIAVKISSNGPIFHRGTRSGRSGMEFRIYKFRSMRLYDGGNWELTTAKGDPRLTRIGIFIRKFKLDELPQLFNVLRGEMSIVGPRPEIPAYTSLYSEDEKIILSVRPGITDYASIEFSDLATVVGSENADKEYMDQVWERKNRLRLKYVLHNNFFIDLKIIFITLTTIVRK